MISIHKFLSLFLMMAVLLETVRAGAFSRRSPTTTTTATTITAAATTEKTIQVSLSVLPQVPAFVGDKVRAAASVDPPVTRREVKAESTNGYRLEASLFAQDTTTQDKN